MYSGGSYRGGRRPAPEGPGLAVFLLCCVLHLLVVPPGAHVLAQAELRGVGDVGPLGQSAAVRSPEENTTARHVLRGRLTDAHGGGIAGGTVTLKRLGRPMPAEGVATQGVRKGSDEKLAGEAFFKTATDSGGGYNFARVPPGVYELSAAARGFEPTVTTIEVGGGRPSLTFDVQLETGRVHESVEVKEAGGLGGAGTTLGLAQEANASALVLGEEELAMLPDDPEALAAALRAVGAARGGDPSNSTILVDGMSASGVPPKDQIKEVRIGANPLAAEYDSPGAGRIEVITKPGAGALHGSFYTTFGDDGFNTRNPFMSSRPPTRTSYTSAYLTGPVRKDKATFSLSAFRSQVDDAATVNAETLNANLERTHFSQSYVRPSRQLSLTGRLDLKLSATSSLNGRVTVERGVIRNLGVGAFSLPDQAFTQRTRQAQAFLGFSGVTSPTSILDVRFQFSQSGREADGDPFEPVIQVSDAFTGGGVAQGRARESEKRAELTANGTWSLGRHLLKAGGRLRAGRTDVVSYRDFGGRFIFAGSLTAGGRQGAPAETPPLLLDSLEAYRRTVLLQGAGASAGEIRRQGGGATMLIIRDGDPSAGVMAGDVAAFAQDDWGFRPNLNISYGLRWSRQNGVGGVGSLEPRFGFAWAPGSSRINAGLMGGPKLVVRGGVGLFHTRVDERLRLLATQTDPGRTRQYVLTDPEVLDKFPLVPGRGELAGSGTATTTRWVLDEGIRQPTLLYVTGSVERKIGLLSHVNLHYSFSLGGGLLRAEASGGESPGGGRVWEIENGGRSTQHLLSVSGFRRQSAALSLFGNYTLGFARSDTDGPTSFAATRGDWGAERGPSASDMRHRLSAGGNLKSPLGLVWSPIVIATSGRPFNITTGQDENGDRLFTERPAVAGAGSVPTGTVRETAFGRFDLDPAAGVPRLGRNAGRGSSQFVFNLSVSRLWRFGTSKGDAGGILGGLPGMGAEKPYRLNLSVYVENVLNHPNFDAPVGNLSSPRFGQPTRLNGSFRGGKDLGNRQVELQLRFSF